MVQVRQAKIEDAACLVELFKQLDKETNFMLYEYGERSITVNEQADRIKAFINSSSEAMFVAEEEHSILGFAVGIGGTANRNRHSASIVIGILRNYWNKGLGQKLMQNLEKWAQTERMHRLELTVIAYNVQAVALYKKCGFEQEGIKRDALRIEGKYVNEIYMSKLI